MRYTVDEIKEIVAALAAQYGADRIYLFGSYASVDAVWSLLIGISVF